MQDEKQYTNQVQILHFSDLHFGARHICTPEDPTAAPLANNLSSLIIDDLSKASWLRFHDEQLNLESLVPPSENKTTDREKKYLENTPVLLAVTGDFTERAQQTEFNQAFDFLNTFVNKDILQKKITKENIFMIPGNHDVLFDEPDVEKRFQPYCTFYNKFYRGTQRAMVNSDEAIKFSQIHTMEIPNKQQKPNKVLVAEINCCMYVENDKINSSRGQVNEQAIDNLRNALTELKNQPGFNDYIKVAMIHHHVVLLPSFIEYKKGIDSVVNARMLMQLLSEFNFHVILHGHKHYPQIFSYDPVSSWMENEPRIPQLIIAAGSCGSRELPDNTPKACNTYSLITIKWHPDAHQARINVITRGLLRRNNNGATTQGQWKWVTVNITDKKVAPQQLFHLNVTNISKYDTQSEGVRKEEYKRLRCWMPVVDVMPSLVPGQAYQVNAWLTCHKKHCDPKLKTVEWSAGELFGKQLCEAATNPNFSASFHYWGPMLLQAKLTFEDDYIAYTHIYSHMPQSLIPFK